MEEPTSGESELLKKGRHGANRTTHRIRLVVHRVSDEMLVAVRL